MRKLGIIVLVIVVLLLIALAVAPSFIDVNQYRGRIEAEARQRLGRKVALGQMHLKLLPPAFRVENASIGEDPRFGREQFAQVQELYISVKLWPLLHKDVQISSLDLRRPRIELIRNAQGVWNFSTLGHQAEAAPPPSAPSKPQPQAQPQPPQSQPAPASA